MAYKKVKFLEFERSFGRELICIVEEKAHGCQGRRIEKEDEQKAQNQISMIQNK
jgi:hypothetical protein